jgi:hypothetical protein
MKKLTYGLVACSLVLGAPVQAAKTINLTPVATEHEEVRYEQGTPTIENEFVRVMPLRELDHGSMQFKVAVFNAGENTFNFGVENIKFSGNGADVGVFTREQLEKKAKKRAMWSQIGYAMLAGVAAAAQINIYTATTYTPRGVYRTVIHQPGLSDGQIATIAAGGGAIALSQIGLQKTLEALGDEIVQTTTVDSGTGYGGRIVVGKLKKAKHGDRVTLDVDTGGTVSQFTFVVQ